MASCIVCRDYSAIDQFAFKYNLQKVRNDAGDEAQKLWAIFLQASLSRMAVPEEEFRGSQAAQLNIENITKRANEASELSRQYNEKFVKKNKIAAEKKQILDDLSLSAGPMVLLGTPQFKTAQAEYITALQKAMEKEDLAAAEKNNAMRLLLQSNEYTGILAELKKTRAEQVGTIAIELWLLCQKEVNLQDSDHIGRARLFFTWIATSIQFSNEVKDNPDLRRMRSPADTVFRAREVCEGFSELFVHMWNATVTRNYLGKDVSLPADFLAMYATGFAKDDARGFDATTNTLEGKGHAWSAFPYLDASGQKQFQLIDACWAPSDQGLSQFKPMWFSKLNADFVRDHVQTNTGVPGTEYATGATKSATETKRNEMLAREGCVTLANRLHDYARIDECSLRPAAFRITKPSKPQVFSFKLACSHAPKPTDPKLYITASTGDQMVSFENIAPFERGADGKYTAALDLSRLPKVYTVKLSIVAAFFTQGIDADHPDRQPDYRGNQPAQIANLATLQTKLQQGQVFFHEFVRWQYAPDTSCVIS